MSVGDVIKQRRAELGLTLEEVGLLVGVGKSTVRKWEHGMIENMKRDKITKLAAALQLPTAVLLGIEEKEEKPITNEDDGLTKSQLELMEFARGLSDQEAKQVLQTMKLLVQGLRK